MQLSQDFNQPGSVLPNGRRTPLSRIFSGKPSPWNWRWKNARSDISISSSNLATAWWRCCVKHLSGSCVAPSSGAPKEMAEEQTAKDLAKQAFSVYKEPGCEVGCLDVQPFEAANNCAEMTRIYDRLRERNDLNRPQPLGKMPVRMSQPTDDDFAGMFKWRRNQQASLRYLAAEAGDAISFHRWNMRKYAGDTVVGASVQAAETVPRESLLHSVTLATLVLFNSKAYPTLGNYFSAALNAMLHLSLVTIEHWKGWLDDWTIYRWDGRHLRYDEIERFIDGAYFLPLLAGRVEREPKNGIFTHDAEFAETIFNHLGIAFDLYSTMPPYTASAIVPRLSRALGVTAPTSLLWSNEGVFGLVADNVNIASPFELNYNLVTLAENWSFRETRKLALELSPILSDIEEPVAEQCGTFFWKLVQEFKGTVLSYRYSRLVPGPLLESIKACTEAWSLYQEEKAIMDKGPQKGRHNARLTSLVKETIKAAKDVIMGLRGLYYWTKVIHVNCFPDDILIFSPSLCLNRILLHAIPYANEDGHPIIHYHPIVYSPSSAVLKECISKALGMDTSSQSPTKLFDCYNDDGKSGIGAMEDLADILRQRGALTTARP
ncbi:hypothetical protein DL766_006785 [Monosporascus sp. MC13-8B]|nr:hypothetical protein DL763_000540 [Monosporascus cannonballus]RYP26200.1 hypothetical protein DL766_006785 [Monosporascus sp. MC13-8B]